MWWNHRGLSWINPLPNFRSPDAAVLYPGTVMFEGTNLNEGGVMTVPVLVIVVSDRERVVPIQVRLQMLRAIYKRHLKEFQWRQQSIDRLAGSPRLRAAVEKDSGVEALLPILAKESEEFKAKTIPYWLYK